MARKTKKNHRIKSSKAKRRTKPVKTLVRRVNSASMLPVVDLR